MIVGCIPEGDIAKPDVIRPLDDDGISPKLRLDCADSQNSTLKPKEPSPPPRWPGKWPEREWLFGVRDRSVNAQFTCVEPSLRFRFQSSPEAFKSLERHLVAEAIPISP